jgi:hypothetical protein
MMGAASATIFDGVQAIRRKHESKSEMIKLSSVGVWCRCLVSVSGVGVCVYRIPT